MAVKQEVETILDKNLKNVANVTQIYQKFAYLLTEREKVEQWTQAVQHTREEYKKEIEKYEKTYSDVMA